ncbi:unnamed protein product [Peniophora sp. CBMAI 1063]|nr:unnamed protein product [Peniophora sp. CBMAI 1063]
MAESAAPQEEDSPTSLPRLHVKATAEQNCHLQAAFLADAHPTAETKQSLADLTGLSYRWITAWFSRKRRVSGLGVTPPAAHRTGSSRSGGGRSFHERLATQDHPSPAGLALSTASPGFSFTPSGWPGPRLTGPGTPGIPLGSPLSRSYPPALDMDYSIFDYEEDVSTPSLASGFSTTSSPFPLTPFSLDVYDSPIDILPSKRALGRKDKKPTGLLGVAVSDVPRTGLSSSTFIDWQHVLSSDNDTIPAPHFGSGRGLATGSAHVPSYMLPGLTIPNTWPPNASSPTPASSSHPATMTSSPVQPKVTPVSYPVRLSEIRAAHRLAYVNYLNAKGTGSEKKPVSASSHPSPVLDPILSQMLSSSSPAPVRISTPIKRPASGSSLCLSGRKKPRFSSDDKENWPPSSPSPAIV